MKLIRGSELQDFLRCRLRWKWAWVDGYKPKKQAEALSFGTLVHKWMEVFYSTGNCWEADEAMRELYFNSPEIQQNDEVYTLAHGVVFNYFKHYTDTFEVIATELQFMIPLDEELCYTGTIDLIYKLDGKLYFMDHKSTKSIEKYEKNSDMDRQISRYWWALQQLIKGEGYVWAKPYGIEQWVPVEDSELPLFGNIGGFLYNIILKDVPDPPKVLKNGKLSTAKNQNTTYDLYVDQLNKMGLVSMSTEDGSVYIPEEYDDILDYLSLNPREYFKRVEVIRNQREINAAIREFRATAKEMHHIRWYDEQERIYRNITHECHSSCPFYEPCKAGLDGSDVEHLLSHLYTKEDKTNGYHGLCN